MATKRLVEIVLQGKDQTKGAFDQLANSLGVTDARVLKFAASATAVAAAVGTATVAVYKFVDAQAEVASQASDMSYRLGLSVESLSELAYLAESGGVQVNTMTMALQRMVRRVAEAAKGTGEAKDAIKELGIEAQALTALSPDQQFYAIAAALQEVENQSDRVRLAFKLFDSEGVSVIQTLRRDIDEAREAFDRLGGGMSTTFAARSKEFTQAETDLAVATERLKEAVAEPFLAPFTAAVNTLAEAVAALSKIPLFGPGGTPIMPGIGGWRRGGTTPYEDFLAGNTVPGQGTVLLNPGQAGWMAPGAVMAPPDVSFSGNPANPYRGYLGVPDAGVPLDISPDDLGLVGGLDTDLMRGMDDLIGKTREFSSASVEVAATFQSAMSQAFATAITDADNAAEAIANIFVSAFAQLAGSWLSAGIFSLLGLPTFGPFGGGDKTVSDASKSLPPSTVLDKSGQYIDLANGAYGKAFI